MTIRYPSGSKNIRANQTFMTKAIPSTQNSMPTKLNNLVGNRGMTLESDINDTNQFYNDTMRALIFKKPTPINIVHVEYPKRSAAVIREAYFQKASTVDYSGVYKQKALEFEAKETQLKTNFPLHNFHEHQINHLQKAIFHGAIAFVIIRFSAASTTFFLDASHVISMYEEQIKGGRKSIPLSYFESFGYPISTSYGALVDYLSVIDQVYLK